MKTKPISLTATQVKLPMVAAMMILTAARLHAQTLLLDFTQTGDGSYATGWNPVYANFLADTPVATINNIDALGYNFSINHVAVYDNGNVAEPLTRSGFYTFGDNTLDHT